MVLDENQIREFILQEDPDEWIKLAREQSALLRMHYYGEGLSEYLTQIQGLENEDQVSLRRRYAISNAWICESLLRPTDGIWSAKGGVEHIDAPDTIKESLEQELKDVNNGMTLKAYLKNMWFDRFVTDPNGLVFIENGENKAYPTYKSIVDIKCMKVHGITPEYVVFEPHLIEEVKGDVIKVRSSKETQWIVDEENYYLVVKENDTVTITETIKHVYGKVPAVQNSPLYDTNTRIKISPVFKQLDLLSSYLIDNSVNNIYKKLHGFPIFWFYTGKCDSCKGTGELHGEVCGSCNGSKQSMKRDVSDGIPLATPKDSEAPTIAPNIAGYVSPDLETWREQRVELEHIWDQIYFSQWGTTIEKVDNETATGRFIDAQPVVNRLHEYTNVVETVHNKLLELLTTFYAPSGSVEVSKSYGRRYLVETPDQIWKKYLETLEKGADDSTKDLQLSQYYEAEFQSDEFLKEYYLKLIKVEPLVHYNIDEVLAMNVSQSVKDKKVAFTQWKQVTPVSEVIETDVDKLILSLNNFTNESREKQPEQGVEIQGAEV